MFAGDKTEYPVADLTSCSVNEVLSAEKLECLREVVYVRDVSEFGYRCINLRWHLGLRLFHCLTFN